MDAVGLIRFYNYLATRLTPGKKPSIIQVGATRRAQAEQLLAQCTERGIDPKAYVVQSYAVGQWTWQPAFADLIKHLDRYNPETAMEWLATVQAEAPREEQTCPGREIVKRRFQAEGRPDLCRIQRHLSGGFNSASVICQSCPERRACG